jgi:hypothetical protein
MNEFNFDYEGNETPFRMDESGQVFMNATEMAKPFKRKKVNDFLRNKSTIEYINALHEEKSVALISVSADYQFVKTKTGGNDQGTWFQEELVLEFARWLDPRFSLWCNQRIKEIINLGFSALTPVGTECIEDQNRDDDG